MGVQNDTAGKSLVAAQNLTTEFWSDTAIRLPGICPKEPKTFKCLYMNVLAALFITDKMRQQGKCLPVGEWGMICDTVF